MNFGLLLIHGVIGALIAAHGAQKVFGWFDGHGLEGTGASMESLGLRPGKVMAAAAGVSELVGGGLLALGLLTPVAAALVASTMLVASRTAHAGKGPWNTHGGWEYPLTLATVAVGLAFNGAGAWSLDAAIGWSIAGAWWGIGAALVALVGAVGVLRFGHRGPATPRGRVREPLAGTS